MRRRSDDLPAFGRPTSAASVSSFSRSSRSTSSPGRPVSAKRGVCRVGVANCRFPRPPAPPRATTTRAFGAARSATTSSSAYTCVPTGTRSSTSAPSAPCFPPPRPGSPRLALNERLAPRDERSRSSGSATSTTSPPRPPSPPSGPPFGTNFSRRKLSPPSPPRPASTWMRARSWNTARTVDGRKLGGVDDRDGAPLAARAELDPAVLRGKDRVVTAETGAGAGPEARSALPDEDHPGLHVLAGEDLHPQHLRVRVAPVARGAESLLVSHRYSAFFFVVVFFALAFFAGPAAAFGFAAVFGFSSA